MSTDWNTHASAHSASRVLDYIQASNANIQGLERPGAIISMGLPPLICPSESALLMRLEPTGDPQSK